MDSYGSAGASDLLPRAISLHRRAITHLHPFAFLILIAIPALLPFAALFLEKHLRRFAAFTAFGAAGQEVAADAGVVDDVVEDPPFSLITVAAIPFTNADRGDFVLACLSGFRCIQVGLVTGQIAG